MRKAKLIDWIDAYCRIWGHSRRIIDITGLGDWPESVWSRIVDRIPPNDYRSQRFLEVHHGAALTIARVLPCLTERQYIALYVHYVIPQPPKEKIVRLGMSRETYYATLARAHQKLANAIDYGMRADKISLA